MAELTEAVERLDGYVTEYAEEADRAALTSVANELDLIVLPPLFRNTLDEYLDREIAKVVKAVLTEKEQALIAAMDQDYVSQLQTQRRARAEELSDARENRTLSQATARDPWRIYMALDRERDNSKRQDLLASFVDKVRSLEGDPDHRLFQLLENMMDSFVWRPGGSERIGDYLFRDPQECLDSTSEAVGVRLDEDSKYIDIAYYWGITYNMFVDDKQRQVIACNHETMWNPHAAYSKGSIPNFLGNFLSVNQMVELIGAELRR